MWCKERRCIQAGGSGRIEHGKEAYNLRVSTLVPAVSTTTASAISSAATKPTSAATTTTTAVGRVGEDIVGELGDLTGGSPPAGAPGEWAQVREVVAGLANDTLGCFAVAQLGGERERADRAGAGTEDAGNVFVVHGVVRERAHVDRDDGVFVVSVDVSVDGLDGTVEAHMKGVIAGALHLLVDGQDQFWRRQEDLDDGGTKPAALVFEVPGAAGVDSSHGPDDGLLDAVKAARVEGEGLVDGDVAGVVELHEDNPGATVFASAAGSGEGGDCAIHIGVCHPRDPGEAVAEFEDDVFEARAKRTGPARNMMKAMMRWRRDWQYSFGEVLYRYLVRRHARVDVRLGNDDVGVAAGVALHGGPPVRIQRRGGANDLNVFVGVGFAGHDGDVVDLVVGQDPQGMPEQVNCGRSEGDYEVGQHRCCRWLSSRCSGCRSGRVSVGTTAGADKRVAKYVVTCADSGGISGFLATAWRELEGTVTGFRDFLRRISETASVALFRADSKVEYGVAMHPPIDGEGHFS
ncbi:hypothetical protein B0H16DRAFT_1453716 [Mycena metata]|uniref:Uncharacterized protein n=1 Tax=Mycena metata TaxID=1033252 RepID=A0AAD7JMV9_9AGAR|nr:hypothetical protein B0H16DRAFT_1453716 [Mycena metata]